MPEAPRLIVLSNRIADDRPPAGGLVFALHDCLRKVGGVWVGAAAAPNDDPSGELIANHGEHYERYTFEFTDAEHANFYSGYSNSVLWPLCHRRADLMKFDSNFIEGYRAINQRVARALAQILRSSDLIWVHDYHFIPVAQELRKLGCENRIGFFLHIPFPSATDLHALSEGKEFANWIVNYDVVGLQAQRDVRECLAALKQFVRAEMMPNAQLLIANRLVDVRSFPIGVDVADIQSMAAQTPLNHRIDLEPNEKLIIGVDRLDYSKGLVSKFDGFRQFLEQRQPGDPRATLLQIAPSSRAEVAAYRDIRAQLERAVGSTNGQYGNLNWTPIRYLRRSFNRDAIATLYRRADVGLVTPLIDGMNLVAKEYVAAQDIADPGVLILSSLAGAAEALPSALLINPYDADEIAAAIRTALFMPLNERRERHLECMKSVQETDIAAWSQSFINILKTQPISRPYSV